jgi:hypothetical protein
MSRVDQQNFLKACDEGKFDIVMGVLSAELININDEYMVGESVGHLGLANAIGSVRLFPHKSGYLEVIAFLIYSGVDVNKEKLIRNDRRCTLFERAEFINLKKKMENEPDRHIYRLVVDFLESIRDDQEKALEIFIPLYEIHLGYLRRDEPYPYDLRLETIFKAVIEKEKYEPNSSPPGGGYVRNSSTRSPADRGTRGGRRTTRTNKKMKKRTNKRRYKR